MLLQLALLYLPGQACSELRHGVGRAMNVLCDRLCRKGERTAGHKAYILSMQ
jgi:hypothetical protein